MYLAQVPGTPNEKSTSTGAGSLFFFSLHSRGIGVVVHIVPPKTVSLILSPQTRARARAARSRARARARVASPRFRA